MSVLSDIKSALPSKVKQKGSPASRLQESKFISGGKKQRQELGLKNQSESQESKGTSSMDGDVDTNSEQISKLRNRQMIAKPDNLQYDHNLSRGFHAKILHSLYNGPLKKKKDVNNSKHSKNKKKRKSEPRDEDGAKKHKSNPPAPVPAQQTESFDSYAFSMNLINGEEEKVKAQQNKKGKDSNNKYVLFIGNLPFDINREQLEEHFRKTGGIKAIRIPRLKGNDKGKGFAYMEFDGRISHGIALRLHQTTLCGRKINVEFTSIGGGNSVARRNKLKQKNEKRRKMKRH